MRIKSLIPVIMAFMPMACLAWGESCNLGGGSTIMVTSDSKTDSGVNIKLGNDGETAANVTVVVTVSYKDANGYNPKTEDFKGYAMCYPQRTTEIDINVPGKIVSYNIKSVSGKKCD